MLGAAAPAVAGLVAAGDELGAPLLVGAALEIVYDVALWTALCRVRPEGA